MALDLRTRVEEGVLVAIDPDAVIVRRLDRWLKEGIDVALRCRISIRILAGSALIAAGAGP